jgi:hypothetical protein
MTVTVATRPTAASVGSTDYGGRKLSWPVLYAMCDHPERSALTDSTIDPRRVALVAHLLRDLPRGPSEFEIQMWLRWTDMVLFALEEYRARGQVEMVANLEQLIALAERSCDEADRERARPYLARHTTAGRPSLSSEDAKRRLRTDPSGNPYL